MEWIDGVRLRPKKEPTIKKLLTRILIGHLGKLWFGIGRLNLDPLPKMIGTRGI